MGALYLYKLRSDYLLARDHPSPEPVRATLDESLARHFAEACRRALGELHAEDDHSIWMIRELQIDLAVNATWPPEEIARALAAKVARAVHSQLDRSNVSDAVIRFENAAEFLAHYVFETATTGHTDAWYFKAFDSLRSLPTDRCIYEALVRDRNLTEPALLWLHARGQLERVARILPPALQHRIIDLCATCGTDLATASDATVVSAVIAQWWQTRSHHPLILFVVARNTAAAAPSLALKLVQAWHAIAQSRRTDARNTTAPDAFQNNFNGDAQAGLELLNATLASDAPLLRQIRDLIEAHASHELPTQPGESAQTICGGIFLLLQSLIDSGANEVIERIAGDKSEAAALRSIVLLKCLGGERESLHTGDPAFAILHNITEIDWQSVDRLTTRLDAATRLQFLIDALSSRERLTENAWLAGANSESDWLTEQDRAELLFFRLSSLSSAVDEFWSIVARVVMSGFARRLPGFDRSSPEFVRHNFLDVAGSINIEPSGAIAVELERPPLHLVLALAGLDCSSFALPWLDGCETRIEFSS